MDGELVNDVDARDREAAMVLQGYVFHPNMKIHEKHPFRAAHEEHFSTESRVLPSDQRQHAVLARAFARHPRAFPIGADGTDLRSEALVVEPTGDATFLTIKTDVAFIEAGRAAAMEPNLGPRNLSSSTGSGFVSSTRKAATEPGDPTIMQLNIGGK